jgi:ApbE superfamily uncharacterized protein (UPF0280 family)
MSDVIAALLPDGRRLHLQHGPIDIIAEAFGSDTERKAAYDQAIAYMGSVLTTLAPMLPELRKPVQAFHAKPLERETIAGRMKSAVWPHREVFVSPMAAVAGAVADAVLQAMTDGRDLERAYANNGGDIAVYLAAGQTITVAAGPNLADRVAVGQTDTARGVATSGWRGRSMSLGIADAVTVLAASAAEADVAATLIANAVDLPGHPSILRQPANRRDPDSDLGTQPVTTGVGPLSDAERARALERGLVAAQKMCGAGLIEGAALWLADSVVKTDQKLLDRKGDTDA